MGGWGREWTVGTESARQSQPCAEGQRAGRGGLDRGSGPLCSGGCVLGDECVRKVLCGKCVCQPRELHVSDTGVWTGLCWGKQRHGLVAGCGGGLVQGHPGLGGRDGAETLAAFFFSAGSQCSLPSSHTCPPTQSSPVPRAGEQGDLLAGVSGKRNRPDCAFSETSSGEGPLGLPQPRSHRIGL